MQVFNAVSLLNGGRSCGYTADRECLLDFAFDKARMILLGEQLIIRPTGGDKGLSIGLYPLGTELSPLVTNGYNPLSIGLSPLATQGDNPIIAVNNPNWNNSTTVFESNVWQNSPQNLPPSKQLEAWLTGRPMIFGNTLRANLRLRSLNDLEQGNTVQPY